MTNSEVNKLIRDTIKSLQQVYPFPDDSDVDDKYALVIGITLGLLTKTLWAVTENKPLDININFTTPR